MRATPKVVFDFCKCALLALYLYPGLTQEYIAAPDRVIGR